MLTTEDVADYADVSKFLEEMEEEYTHGQCHQSITWLAVQLKRAGEMCYNIHLCSGTFAGMDHSWIQVENEEGEYDIVDMTVDQFAPFKVPYAGPICPGYHLHRSVNMCDEESIPEFIESLGG